MDNTVDVADVEKRAARCRALLADARRRAGEDLDQGASGVAVCRAMSDALDDLVRSLCDGEIPPGVSLVATGGWGRRDTCPYSDIDLLVLCRDDASDAARALADRVLYPLWDAGLEVGHAVRGVDEAVALADQDLATQTALFDARWLAGDVGAVDELVRRIGQRITRGGDSNVFVHKLIEEKRSRHARFGETLFLLEPNLKHGQGALRDLTSGLWAARARFRVRELADLLPLGQASARQIAALAAAREFLLGLRARVHLAARRRLDQLSFELQETLAPRLFPDARVPEGEIRPAVAPAVEELMRRDYLDARAVVRETDRLLDRCLIPPQRAPIIRKVDASFTLWNGKLSVSDPQIFRDRPAEMVRLFQVAGDRDVGVYGHTKELIAERVASDAAGKLTDDPAGHRGFLALVANPRDARRPSLLEEMHELGLVSAMMPEFAPCTGRVQHDLYHVYTVDQHQLYALALLKRVARGELGREDGPAASSVMAACAEVTVPLSLYLATLLHDVGKPLGRGHAEKGARLATTIATRLGMTDDEVERVEFLVRHHLLMSHLSQRRDLADPVMIEKLARTLRDEETLRELYVLTYCDTAMTAPGNLTEWKARLLTELYERTRGFFRRGPDLAGADRSAMVQKRRQRVAELLDEPEGALDEWFAGLPDRYVALLEPPVLAEHIRLARERGTRAAAVSVLHHPTKGYSDLMIVAPNAPGLLARIAGVLLANRMDVLGAHISSLGGGEAGLALDVFVVRDRYGRAIAADDSRWARVEEDLERVLAVGDGAEDVEALIARRREVGGLPRRVTPAVPTEIQIDNEISDEFTVVDVYTHDSVGVLYAITRTLSELGLDIHLSKVATEADRVADISMCASTRAAASSSIRCVSTR